MVLDGRALNVVETAREKSMSYLTDIEKRLRGCVLILMWRWSDKMLFIYLGIYFVFFTMLIAVGSLVQYVLPISDTVMQVAVILAAFLITEQVFKLLS